MSAFAALWTRASLRRSWRALGRHRAALRADRGSVALLHRRCAAHAVGLSADFSDRPTRRRWRSTSAGSSGGIRNTRRDRPPPAGCASAGLRRVLRRALGAMVSLTSPRTSKRSGASTVGTSTRIDSRRSEGGCPIRPGRTRWPSTRRARASTATTSVSSIDFATVSRSDVEDAPSPDRGSTRSRDCSIHATIVGVGAFIEEVVQDDTDRSPLVLFTPAFVHEAKGLELYAWQGLVLRNGDADVAAVKQAITARRAAAHRSFGSRRPTRSMPSKRCGRFARARRVRGHRRARRPRSRRPGTGRHVQSERARAQESLARSAPGRSKIAPVTAIGPAIAVAVGVVLAVVGAVRRRLPCRSDRCDASKWPRGSTPTGPCSAWAPSSRSSLCSAVIAVDGVARDATARAVPRRPHTTPVGRVVRTCTANCRRRRRWGCGSPSCPGQGSDRGAGALGDGQRRHRRRRARRRRHVRREHAAPRLQPAAVRMELGRRARGRRRLRQHESADDRDGVRVNGNIEAWSGAFYGAADVNGLNMPLLGMDPSSTADPADLRAAA